MEPTGKAEEGKAESHLGARFGGGHETDGAQLARNREDRTKQRQVESSSWGPIPTTRVKQAYDDDMTVIDKYNYCDQVK